MELSFSLNYLMKNSHGKILRTADEAAKICRAAGFRYIDYTPDFKSDDWAEKARRDRELFDSLGITVEQTHAPFNRYQTHPDDVFPTYFKRVFEASKILGAKFVVVHADEYRTKDRFDGKEILDFTYDYLAPYVEYCAKNGLVVAVENVFEDDTTRWPKINGRSRYTSRVEELKDVIERFNTPTVRCCWDYGHAGVAYGKSEMANALTEVAKYVVCTHVHDNYYGNDLHLLPFLGDVDWNKNLAPLKEAGYKGKLSLELVYGEFSDALAADFMRFAHSAGKELCDIFDKI
ncbi:MAG: sugar phosphate isomerase/epimerase [Clostridia bacterium]|nr:sugar phosphate isomerase/epimerase [Clostridia bacterium]